MDLTTAASMSVLDNDLERLLEEQRRKLSTRGIFPPTRHTSDAHSADTKPVPGDKSVSHSTLHTSTLPSSKNTHPSGLFTTSREVRSSAGDSASGRLDRVADTEERIARLLGVTRDDGEGHTSKKFDYDAVLRPAMANMPQSAADVLNRIRQKCRAEMSTVNSVKSSQSNTVQPNTKISRLKTVVETETSKKVENTKSKISKNTTTVTKSESRLDAKKTFRSVHSEISANMVTAGKSCEDALSYVDITAKTLGKEATVQIMKAKLTAKEAELSNISETATKNQQLAQKKAAELRQLEQEHRELKEKQIEQEKKVRACMKQLEEARRTSEALTAEVERLSTKAKEKRKGKVEVKKKAMPEISVARLAAANDKAVKELVTLKEQNKVLKETGEKSQKDVENQRKKHDGNLRKFLSVVQKQEALMRCVANQKNLSG